MKQVNSHTAWEQMKFLHTTWMVFGQQWNWSLCLIRSEEYLAETS
ncbi:hypothetical protein [Aneurinibacillus migulanus]|nr:hypothetical protein [Aneurinibacillus migulanus]